MSVRSEDWATWPARSWLMPSVCQPCARVCGRTADVVRPINRGGRVLPAADAAETEPIVLAPAPAVTSAAN
ncbi:hypothetical protein GCM10022376_04850 [Yimella lutea]